MNKIKIIIILLASIIVVTVSLIQNYSLKKLSYTLFIVVVLFYIIGTIIQYLLKRALKDNNSKLVDNEIEGKTDETD